MIRVYGIKQCDTCRKALKWLDAQDVPHTFHDLRVDGLEEELLGGWLATPFADQLVNRRSTTWRSLSEAEKAATGSALTGLLLSHPTLIKRPIFEKDGDVCAVGFKPEALSPHLGIKA